MQHLSNVYFWSLVYFKKPFKHKHFLSCSILLKTLPEWMLFCIFLLLLFTHHKLSKANVSKSPFKSLWAVVTEGVVPGPSPWVKPKSDIQDDVKKEWQGRPCYHLPRRLIYAGYYMCVSSSKNCGPFFSLWSYFKFYQFIHTFPMTYTIKLWVDFHRGEKCWLWYVARITLEHSLNPLNGLQVLCSFQPLL